MILNPRIKQQIYSLKLSNKYITKQIDTFLSIFSLEEFSHLQSLSLFGITQNNMDKLKLMLSLIPKLHSIELINSEEISLIEILSLPKSMSIDRNSFIRNLTLSYRNLTELNQIFQYVPMLKYLHIYYYPSNSIQLDESSHLNQYNVHYLKKLIINDFPYQFKDLEFFLKQASNLESLTILENNNIDLLNAHQWERFITTTLPYLKIFNFIFCYDYQNEDMMNKCKQFQSDFWSKQHHWYTIYGRANNSTFIYTIPSTSDACYLSSYIEKYSNKLMNDINQMDYLTKYLSIGYDILIEKCEHYFPNVTSLQLFNKSGFDKKDKFVLFEKQYIEALEKIVNLFNLKSLSILQSDQSNLSLFLLKILKETPQLSSLCINSENLLSIYNNDKLCKYLNKMITNLELYSNDINSFNNLNDIKKICKIFSNIEQLSCCIDQRNSLLYLLNHLPRLSIINVIFPYRESYDSLFSWFSYEASKLNVIFDINYLENRRINLCIWIDK